jgi:large subunit ribosomal protein L13
MQKTYVSKPSDIQKKWFIVDAKDQVLGRLASQIAYILRGKHKPTFTPHMDDGDNVIVINAEHIKLTGKKELEKIYYRHSGFFGSLREIPAAEIRTKHPERLLELAVKGMLPHNVLGRECFRNLKVYVGGEHPHKAQNPEPLPVRTVRK